MLLAVLFGRGIAHLPGFLVSLQLTSLHYAQTLAHWAEPFALARERVRQAYGDEFQRAWELYLAGSQAAFATGWMQLFQILFTPARVGAPVVDARPIQSRRRESPDDSVRRPRRRWRPRRLDLCARPSVARLQ